MQARARELNPQHPGYYFFCKFYDHLRKEEHREALETAQKIHMPGHFLYHAAVAAAAAHLGLKDEAETAVRELREAFPDFERSARAAYAVWNFPEEVTTALFDGFGKAGLEIT